MFRISFWRLAIATSCVLLMTLTLPLTAFAKSFIAAQSHGPVTVTTDASCSNPTVVVTVGISQLIPSVTVSGTLQLTSSDPQEGTANQPLKVYDTAGFFGPSTISVNSGRYTYTFTATKNDTFKACISGNGPDGDELGTITFNGLITQKSSNYAGYVSSGLTSSSETYSEVQGDWQIPYENVICPVSQSFYSYVGYWVGLGGVNAVPLEQTGIISECYHGVVIEAPFYQILPDQPTSTIIPHIAYSGDNMEAEVAYNGNGQFTLTLNDYTQEWEFSTTQQQTDMNGALSSADWVTEAVTNGNIEPLLNFGTVHFSLCFFEANNPINTDPVTYKDVMVDKNNINTFKAQPSALDNQGVAFDVNWVSSGP